jgi:hypothetical protein
VWAAYRNVSSSEEGIDLDSWPEEDWESRYVSPQDIHDDNEVQLHRNEAPCRPEPGPLGPV